MPNETKKNHGAPTAEPSEEQVGRKKHWMLNIQVTKDIIANAERMDSKNCMVADSIKTAAKAAGADVTNVQVDEQSIRMDMNGKRRIWWTPPIIAKDINRFERGFHVKPFKFELRSGRELQVTDIPTRRQVKARTAARKRGKLESKVVTRPKRNGKRGRQTDFVRVREIGGAPFPRLGGRHRRVFGHRGLTLAEFGPEYEQWVRDEARRQAEILVKKFVKK